MSRSRRAFERVAEVRRGGAGESWHFGAVAVVDRRGRLLASCGDPEVEVFVRSAAKPFQILPLLAAGGAERFGLEAADLALICASHSGNPEHVERAAALLERGGFSRDDLRCGAHPPMNPAAAERLRAGGEEPSALHNNCSGKHAGMLLACRLLDLDPAAYEDPGHPLQEAISTEIERYFDLDRGAVGRAIDGCSLPTFRLPLARLARAYARLGDPSAAGVDPASAATIDRVYGAMTKSPEMVAGSERFTTQLMQAAAGRLLGKEGAEGVYAIAVRRPRRLGIAIKIADGGERCRDGVVLDVLRRLGCLHEPELEPLQRFDRPVLRNWRGLEVGEIVPEVPLVAIRPA